MNLPDNRAELKCGKSADSTEVVRLMGVNLVKRINKVVLLIYTQNVDYKT